MVLNFGCIQITHISFESVLSKLYTPLSFTSKVLLILTLVSSKIIEC